MAFTALDDDTTSYVMAHLTPSELLPVACVSRNMRRLVDENLAADGVLALASSGVAVSDELLLFLAKRRLPRHSLRTIDIAGCASLSKLAIWLAAKNSPRLRELIATKAGASSWTITELQRILDACPALRSLHVDCKSKGVSEELVRMLSNPALKPRSLVLHKAASSPDLAGLADAADAADAAADADPSDEFSRALTSALHGVRATLRELEAKGGALEGVGLAHVAKHLGSEGCALQRLTLPGVPHVRGALGQLADGLAANCRLETLEVNPGPATTRPKPPKTNRSPPLPHARRLPRATQRPPHTHTHARARRPTAPPRSQLGCNFINAAGATQLASAVANHPALKTLELPHNPLLDGGVSSLAAALRSNRSLTSLSVPFTGLGDDACAALAQAIVGGSTVAALDLSGNRVTAAGAAMLAEALGGGASLTSLNLSANGRVGNEGALSLAASLAASGLERLSLAGCSLTAAPCGRLVDAIGRSSVRELDLSSNELGDLGACELAWGIASGSPLHTLRLAVNSIEEEGAAELLAALDSCPSLRCLDLRGNRIPDDSDAARALGASPAVNVNFQYRAFCTNALAK